MNSEIKKKLLLICLFISNLIIVCCILSAMVIFVIFMQRFDEADIAAFIAIGGIILVSLMITDLSRR